MTDLSKFWNDIELKMEFNDETVTFFYDPSKYTTRWHAKSISQAVPWDELAEKLCELITKWDLTQNGEAVPIEADMLLSFPVDFLMGFYNQIQLDLFPSVGGEDPKENPKNSTES